MSNAAGSDAERVRREQEFHDERFADGGGERPADRFYALSGPSDRLYESKLAELGPGARVLELGCGLSIGAWDLLPRGIDVTAIDISQVAIDQAADKARSIGEDPDRFVQMNAEALDYADDTFDAVIGNGILHHLDLDRSLSEIARVLKPGGRAVFSEPTGHNPLINVYRRFTPDQRTDDEHPLLVGDFDTVRRYFGDVELKFFHFTSLVALGLLKTKAFDPVAARLEALDQQLFRRFPRLERYGWMVILDARRPIAR